MGDRPPKTATIRQINAWRCCVRGRFGVISGPYGRGWKTTTEPPRDGSANGSMEMRGLRYDRILTGTAVALVLAAVTGAHAASTKTTAVVAHKPKVTTE